MEQYVGLDVSLKETHFCVVDPTGAVVARGREATHPELLAAALERQAPAVRVAVLETGSQSSWLQRALDAAGLPAVIVDARRAKAALSCRYYGDSNRIGFPIGRFCWRSDIVIRLLSP